MKLVELIAKLACEIMNLSLHFCEFVLQKEKNETISLCKLGLGNWSH